jgi:hypothetical protein
VVHHEEAPGRLGVLRDALQQLQGPAALGTLVPLFAHAANNRLTVILASLDLLDQVDLGDSDLGETLRLAREAGRELGADLAALQATSRGRAREPSTVAVADAVTAALDLVELAAARRPVIDVDVPADLCIVAEPGALDLALSRLLWLGVRSRAASLSLRASRIEIPARTSGSPALRAGPHVRIMLRLEGVSPPAAWVRATTHAGYVVERLEDPDGLEFAAVEAFATSTRGSFVARADRAATVLDLYVPGPVATR